VGLVIVITSFPGGSEREGNGRRGRDLEKKIEGRNGTKGQLRLGEEHKDADDRRRRTLVLRIVREKKKTRKLRGVGGGGGGGDKAGRGGVAPIQQSTHKREGEAGKKH